MWLGRELHFLSTEDTRDQAHVKHICVGIKGINLSKATPQIIPYLGGISAKMIKSNKQTPECVACTESLNIRLI